MEQPRRPQRHLPGGGHRLGGHPHLAARAQHAAQHARARHPERLRLHGPALRFRRQRNHDPVRRDEHVLDGLLHRHAQHAQGCPDRHRAGHDPRHADRRGAFFAQPAAAQDLLRLCRVLPQRADLPAVADLVHRLHRNPAQLRRSLASRPLLPEQGRFLLPLADLETGADARAHRTAAGRGGLLAVCPQGQQTL